MFSKRNLIKIFSVLFVLFLYFNSQTFAAPNVINTSGIFSHDSEVVITGTNFGSKGTVPPVIWDNMESGNFSTKWSDVGSNRNNPGFLSINTDNSRHPNSQFNGFSNFDGDGGEACGFRGGSDSPKWYVQYWFKLGTNWTWGTTGFSGTDKHLSNIKFIRMWSTGSEKDNFYLNIHSWNNTVLEASANVSDPNGSQVYMWGSFKDDLKLDTWHLFQFEFKDSSMDTLDGEFRFWFNGKLIRETTTLKTRDGSTAFKRPQVLGFYDAWNGGNLGDNFMWIDDAYIDNTFARVEIGDKPVYNDCTHREIQIPTTWSDSSIEFTVNQGSFARPNPDGLVEKLDAYLFVVDSNGNVSEYVDSEGNVSEGFKVQFALRVD